MVLLLVDPGGSPRRCRHAGEPCATTTART